MISRIQTLPEEVVHRIAAGEVIDSLAAVVRELAENAIDAGASRIAIALYPDQWKVRVTDNGSGMTQSDLQQAAIAHSTSKIYTGEDLWQITSLGFRGEALHSLSQLSTLEIGSRPADAWEGWWVRYDAQGNPKQQEVVAIAPGTVVLVSDLFGRWLPRRQSLPSASQQLRAVQMVVQHLALCHPNITWQVQNGDRDWFSIGSSKTALQILPQLLREVHPSDLREVNWSDPTVPSSFLHLTLGLPDRCHRHRPDWIKMAINGRVVRLPELEQTVMGVFRRILPRDRHPVCFTHLHLPPDQVDWNRHPAKAEIYLRHLEFWQNQLEQAIAQALQLVPTAVSEATYNQQVGQLLKTAEAGGGYSANRSIAPQSKIPNSLQAIAQLHQTYILVEHPNGIWLVEQHIAHERVLYEQLCDRWQLVTLEPPVVLADLRPAQIEQLHRLGMEPEPFGQQRWAIRQAPEPLANRQDCADALLELSLGGNLESALVATACRTAIRNGTPLTRSEMQTLIDQWQQTRNPRTCPHGRPICLSLEESSLSRYFRRHWVIGKSHGI